MIPVIIQSNILVPTKLCAKSITLFLSFVGEDEDEEEEEDDDDCPNPGGRDGVFSFFIELRATPSSTVTLKCHALLSS